MLLGPLPTFRKENIEPVDTVISLLLPRAEQTKKINERKGNVVHSNEWANTVPSAAKINEAQQKVFE